MLSAMFRYIVSVLLLGLLTAAVQAAVYKRVNPDGTVEYSDQPFEGATVIENPGPST
jgi:hypothetical protein